MDEIVSLVVIWTLNWRCLTLQVSVSTEAAAGVSRARLSGTGQASSKHYHIHKIHFTSSSWGSFLCLQCALYFLVRMKSAGHVVCREQESALSANALATSEHKKGDCIQQLNQVVCNKWNFKFFTHFLHFLVSFLCVLACIRCKGTCTSCINKHLLLCRTPQSCQYPNLAISLWAARWWCLADHPKSCLAFPQCTMI